MQVKSTRTMIAGMLFVVFRTAGASEGDAAADEVKSLP
eukprot:SAG31_NODE_8228_length_1493_cov_1.910330_1_plen_37_part_10